MTKRRWLGLPLGVLGMSIVIAFALSITGTQPTPTDGNGNPLNEATLQDMKAIAGAEGISYQTAVDSYGWHNGFASAVSDIRADATGGFSAGGISGNHAVWIAFSGAVPSGASGHIQRFQDRYPNITVEFITGAGFSEAQSRAALIAAHYAVLNSPSVAGASSSFDFQTRRIDITANVGTDSPPGWLIPSLRQDAEDAVAEAAGPEMLDLIVVEVVGVNFATGGVDTTASITAERNHPIAPAASRWLTRRVYGAW